jgi:hypothetical protein
MTSVVKPILRSPAMTVLEIIPPSDRATYPLKSAGITSRPRAASHHDSDDLRGLNDVVDQRHPTAHHDHLHVRADGVRRPCSATTSGSVKPRGQTFVLFRTSRAFRKPRCRK